MTFELLIHHLNKARIEHPTWFGIEPTPPASDPEIVAVERALNITFPPDLRKVVQTHGSGYFAFAELYTLDLTESHNIVEQNKAWGRSDFFIFSDNGCGDVFGFRRIQNGEWGPQIHMHDHETGMFSEIFPNVFSFFATEGLRIPAGHGA